LRLTATGKYVLCERVINYYLEGVRDIKQLPRKVSFLTSRCFFSCLIYSLHVMKFWSLFSSSRDAATGIFACHLNTIIYFGDIYVWYYYAIYTWRLNVNSYFLDFRIKLFFYLLLFPLCVNVRVIHCSALFYSSNTWRTLKGITRVTDIICNKKHLNLFSVAHTVW
jgi:hypothetical protein